MRQLIIPLVFLLGGCVSLDDVVGGIANTPDWFQEKRVEIRGEGYPSFRDVPAATDAQADDLRLRSEEEATRALLSSFLSDERAQPAEITTADIDKRADDLSKLLVLEGGPNDRILTPAEIQALSDSVIPPPIPE